MALGGGFVADRRTAISRSCSTAQIPACEVGAATATWRVVAAAVMVVAARALAAVRVAVKALEAAVAVALAAAVVAAAIPAAAVLVVAAVVAAAVVVKLALA
jgi:hypothetical protein